MSDSLKFQVILTADENTRVKSSLPAGFNREGDLVLEGQDIGSFVEETWGRDEYEYWLTVRKTEISRLAEELARQTNQSCPTAGEEQPFITNTLKKLFFKEESTLQFASESEFGKWLEAHGIPSEFSSWP